MGAYSSVFWVELRYSGSLSGSIYRDGVWLRKEKLIIVEDD